MNARRALAINRKTCRLPLFTFPLRFFSIMLLKLHETVPPIHSENGLLSFSFQAIGSHCEVQFRSESSQATKAFRAAAIKWLLDFEAAFSRFIPASELSRINAVAGKSSVSISPEMEEMLELCDRLFILSKGINDPTSLPLTQLWDLAEREQRLPFPEEIAATQQKTGWGKVERSPGKVRLPIPGMALDFGGFGKEFAVDRIIQIASDHGIENVLVDLGRDVATRGRPVDQPSWVVGVENVNAMNEPLARMALNGQAIASSGNYRRFRVIQGKSYGHQIDPRNGQPASTELDAVSCIANSCVIAGLFSQSAFILGLQAGLNLIESQPDVEAVFQTFGNIHRTQNIHRYEI
jgi:FAD:protein FMN transferase